MRFSKLMLVSAALLITAGAGSAYSGLLEDTVFNKVVSNHYALSFAWEENSDFLYPTRMLDADDLVLIPYTSNDILLIRENGALTDILRQEGLQYRYSLPLDFPLPGSVAGIAYRRNDLSGKLPSLSFARLNSEQDIYAGALATSLGRYSLGLSGRRSESAYVGDLSIKEYPHSEVPLENEYFYDLVEKYFGKDMRLSDQGGQNAYVAEGKVKLNSGNILGVRAAKNKSLDRFSLSYYSQDKISLKYIDSPLNILTYAYEAYFRLEVKEWWAVKFLAGREMARMRLDLIPRGVDPETEITDLGNVSLDGKGAGYGVSTLFRISDRTRIFGGFYYSRMKNHVRAYFSTPVLGKGLDFIPIVHRAKFDAGFSTPSKQWQLGLVKEFGKRFEVSSVVNCQILDIPLRVSGETNLVAGLANSSFDKKIRVRGVKLLYGYASAGCHVFKNLKLAYRADLSTPILPKNFNKMLNLPETGQNPPAPGLPKEVSIEKNISGGISHRITLQYGF
ncbi:MAG: hypothetical protein KKH28_03710 [Elusimicrobia bacterium]|nr:hypothetical protein [Elusimicrobiota bacterium]